jgi:hypothetical protein
MIRRQIPSYLPAMCHDRHTNFDSAHFFLVYLACDEGNRETLEPCDLGTGLVAC